jgi:Poly(ADP-ribose) polymerase catalytic domain
VKDGKRRRPKQSASAVPKPVERVLAFAAKKDPGRIGRVGKPPKSASDAVGRLQKLLGSQYTYGGSRRCNEGHPRTWGLFDEGEYHKYLPKKQPLSPEGDNHRVLYHGTSVSRLVGILEDGLAPSSSGLLGPGIYLGGRPKAERYFRNPDAGVLLECRVALGRVFDAAQLTWGVPKGYGAVRGVPDVTPTWGGFLREEEFIVPSKSQIAICAIWLFKGPENTCSQCGKSFFRSELRAVDYYRRYCAACMK